jgi:hypothetical protein
MSIEPPRDKWQPTMHLRWNIGGKLQQMWWREVDEYSTFWKRTLWKPEYEWRDITTEQPSQETLPAHLQDDAPYKQCDICGRKSWEQPGIGVACDMRQPNGWRCDGTLIPTPNRR